MPKQMFSLTAKSYSAVKELRKIKLLCCAIAFNGGLGVSAASLAQEQGLALEEVVVTAQKREQSLQDVPISITSVDNSQLTKARARTIEEMQSLAPNFSLRQTGGFVNLSIRGVDGGGRNIGFDTRAGAYIDGVYSGQSGALNQPLLDIARIEVLRGPQGHLFGRNTVSGAVNIVTEAPSEEFSGYVRAVVGNYKTSDIFLGLNGPVSEHVLGKISLGSEYRDGYIENTLKNKDLEELERLTFRGQLRFLVSEKMTVDVYADYSDRKTTNIIGEPVINTDTDNVELRPYRVAFDVTPVNNAELYGSSVTVNYDLDSEFAFTSITAYRYTDQLRTNDTDYSPLLQSQPGGGMVDYGEEFKQTSQEFRITSPGDGAARYLIGLYLLHEEAVTDRDAELAGMALPIDGTVETDSIAVYGALDYDITESLTLNLGARYTQDKKDLKFSIDADAIGLAELNNYTDDRKQSKASPTVGLTYAINDDSNVYGKVSTGFKSGGWNVEYINPAQVADGIDFDTEEVISYEIGYKGLLVDQRLQMNLAIFLSDFDDFQTFQLNEVAPGTTILQLDNAGEARTQGAELSLKFLATENLQLGLNLGMTDAEFTVFENANGGSFTGNELPSAPDLSGVATADYSLPLSVFSAMIDFYLEISYADESYSEASNADDVYLDSHTLVNTRMTYRPLTETWSVGLWARNLLDEEYLVNAGQDFLGDDYVRRGEPMTVGIEGRINF